MAENTKSESYAINWQYSKKYPTGAPMFFVNGRSVTRQLGVILYKLGRFGNLDAVDKWIEVDERSL